MPKKKKSPQKAKKNSDSVALAFVATFFSIIGFLIVLLTKKDDKYVMFYAKQSLVIFIAWIVIWILGFIPILGWILKIIWVIVWAVSWIYALTGEMRTIPVIGELGEKFNF